MIRRRIKTRAVIGLAKLSSPRRVTAVRRFRRGDSHTSRKRVPRVEVTNRNVLDTFRRGSPGFVFGLVLLVCAADLRAAGPLPTATPPVARTRGFSGSIGYGYNYVGYGFQMRYEHPT